jgi:hypothetical protein
MAIFEIICLASSTKYGGLCIAGLKTDRSGWLRPISTREDGALYPNDYLLDLINRPPQIFDILRIECLEHRLKPHQPENWVISKEKWQLIGSLKQRELIEIIKPELDKNTKSEHLFGNSSDRVEYELLQQNHASHSLAYIKPTSIIWIVSEYQGKKNYRAKFTLANNSYDLKITDPDWKDRMDKAELPMGNYSSSAAIDKLNLIGFTSEGFRLTISLGEPFIPNGSERKYCFKMIAAVINTTSMFVNRDV